MLSPWQDWAEKALHVTNESFLMLFFHEDNIKYITSKTQKKVQEATGMPSPKPGKQQLVVILLMVYDDLRLESRNDLRKLLTYANKRVISSLVETMMTNLGMYTKYYNDKMVRPQPLPINLPKNTSIMGSRALEGGKPFI